MEQTRLHRGRLIDHIQLVVRDLAASEGFYRAVMAVLEISVMGTDQGYFVADELVVSAADSPTAAGALTGRHHLAFQAKDRATVDAFYGAALAHGGRDNGAPGLRACHPEHYAAFVLDPDGKNIEAVYQGEAKRSARSVTIEVQARRLDPAGARQGHVHHHDIGAQGAETGTGGARVLGLSGDRQARLQVDQAAVALAQDRGVVGDDDAVRLHAAERPRAIGTRTRMRPPRAPSSSRSLPPIAPVRSAMPIRPWPGAPVDPAAAFLDGQDDIAPLGMQDDIDPGGHAVAHGIGDAFLHDPEEIERHGAAQAVLVQRAVQPRPGAALRLPAREHAAQAGRQPDLVQIGRPEPGEGAAQAGRHGPGCWRRWPRRRGSAPGVRAARPGRWRRPAPPSLSASGRIRHAGRAPATCARHPRPRSGGGSGPAAPRCWP
ncbi:catechol 2,3-dioxygenase-like lactoylglutathione lyase family enzyme [Rhodovulum visakhapatnamense]|uniref:Catechol 2,3-dioxygenase-like lactoylglutathione lyase family enzyme n=1 Tax=Rhodovulum visakhapatnamense TaxID=364297 RepID=A0A4R8FEA8_9RHOB|nr:catechol 2,3-dioxygenase-like lactoylglutathione lyase family enzyme [Rhodovulum visakhapatnamense]